MNLTMKQTVDCLLCLLQQTIGLHFLQERMLTASRCSSAQAVGIVTLKLLAPMPRSYHQCSWYSGSVRASNGNRSLHRFMYRQLEHFSAFRTGLRLEENFLVFSIEVIMWWRYVYDCNWIYWHMAQNSCALGKAIIISVQPLIQNVLN